MTATLASVINAARVFAAKPDTQFPAQRGVLCDSESRVIVATDGVAMFVSRPGSGPAIGTVLVPPELEVFESIEIVGDMLISGGSVAMKMDASQFPTWRVAYRNNSNFEKQFCYDFYQLEKVAQANIILGCDPKFAGQFIIYPDDVGIGRIKLYGGQAHVMINPLRGIGSNSKWEPFSL